MGLWCSTSLAFVVYAGPPIAIRVLVFTEYTATDNPMYLSTPGPFGGRGDTPRWGLMAGASACCSQHIRYCPFLSPCTRTVTVSGAAGHNRGGVVERRLFARTQGRTAHCTFKFSTSFHQALLQGGFFF